MFFIPVCLSVCMISEKVMDGFRQNLVDRLGVWPGRIVLILVKIRFQIQILEFLTDFNHLEIRPKMIYSTISQNIVVGFGWNLVDRLGVWHECLILVKVSMQIWLISGIQNVNCSAWQIMCHLAKYIGNVLIMLINCKRLLNHPFRMYCYI